MKIISFNVNGIRATVKKGLLDTIAQLDADIYCFQETKASEAQVVEALQDLHGYEIYANSAIRPGYSSTAIITRQKPVRELRNMGIDAHDTEGRIIGLEFEKFILINTYVPNSGNELVRLPYRKTWDDDFRAYLLELEKTKPVVLCGDLNVAHKPIDIARPQANYNKTAGYTQTEIDGIDALVTEGFVDTYRHFYPETVKYSWWSFRGGARQNNIGWRLDYFLISQKLKPHLVDAFILNDVHGSDHCPVGITLKF